MKLASFYEANATPEMKESLPVTVAGVGKETRELSVTWLFNVRGAEDIYKHVKATHMKSTHRMTSMAIEIPLKLLHCAFTSTQHVM